MGNNQNGKLGVGSNKLQDELISIPKLLDGLKAYKIHMISFGKDHTGAISQEGFCFMWGSNLQG